MAMIRILLVDDEQRVLDGLARNLSVSYEIVTATSGADALAALREQGEFAIVVADMQMPGMDGLSFLQKTRVEWPKTVRILLSGVADLDALKGKASPGDLFLSLAKPCRFKKLAEALESAAEEHRRLTAST